MRGAGLKLTRRQMVGGLAGCAVVGASMSAWSEPSYFSAAFRAAIVADPTAISTVYERQRERFLRGLGPFLTSEPEEQIKLAFCAVMAFDLKPCGTSTANTLEELLAAPALDCDNYCLLAWRLFRLLSPEAAANVHIVGWDRGPVANHAQLYCRNPAENVGRGGGWLVDPTCAAMQCGYSFAWIAAGMPCDTNYCASFFYRRPGIPVYWLHRQLRTALRKGLFRRSQIIYFEPIETFARSWKNNTRRRAAGA